MSKTVIFNPPFNVGSSEEYGKALQAINNKIDEIGKTITYLDVYNIVDVVTDYTKLPAQINSLPNNSSLVINAPSFVLNEETYKTGDIILKLYNGTNIHIRAQAGGIFYPSSLITKDGGKNYTLQYSFSPSEPVEGSSTGTLAKTISFENIKTDNSNKTIYGIFEEFGKTGSYYFDAITSVQPQIQFWKDEEIFCDFILTLTNNQYKVTVEGADTTGWKIKVK